MSSASSSSSSSNRLEMPFASVPESVPGGPALDSAGAGKGGKGQSAAGGGGGGGQHVGASSGAAAAVPATLPPRKNYDDNDSNQGGALRQVDVRSISWWSAGTQFNADKI